MIVLVNFNEYLGGGETLLVRISEAIGERNCLIVGSKGSYIDSATSERVSRNGCFYEHNYSYHYLDSAGKAKLFSWLDDNLPKETLKIVTFCLRDLHLLHDFMHQKRSHDYSLTHLLLHPLDHLYLCQDLKDKALHMLCGSEKFSLTHNKKSNATLLRQVAHGGGLIPMNMNVLKRLAQDTGIHLPSESIIALPYFDEKKVGKVKLTNQFVEPLRIVWMGRIVDFKLPAILTMIDAIAQDPRLEFHIIGYGNEKAVTKHINNKGVASRVHLEGKVKPEELPEKLSRFHIGYAMGTSLVELTAHGLPTIVALAKPDFKPFSKPICAGLVNELEMGNVGDDLYAIEADKLPSIASKVEEIYADPDRVLAHSLMNIQSSFNLNENISKYLKVIEHSGPFSSKEVNDLKLSKLKKLAFKVAK
ncbi:hypothetical protein M5216_004213 [Vibrio vulnificus]|uniref:hypothetical protein n=1 Tax=Vibrio vulnificus TaxID=672 RepID=UPI001EEC135D|nr:hypothetical protein [Vibrio vulnificus]EHZ7120550.1 hypothetical protein [Vibrio vulnificus]EJE8737474.1 hypothetical protein [Vibrio vulnificus]EJL7832586.1 hypothetical protein [Vibrio vulnificus]EKO5190443.1 hypothetical protein [Vibrio vulnificus]MCG6275305.1 hypothetical protein [Vibrio vulnificus]